MTTKARTEAAKQRAPEDITPGEWHVEAIVSKEGTKMFRVLNACGLGIADFATWGDADACANVKKYIEIAEMAKELRDIVNMRRADTATTSEVTDAETRLDIVLKAGGFNG